MQRTAPSGASWVRGGCWLVAALAGAAVTLRQIVHATRTPSIDLIHVWSATHQLVTTGGAYRDPMFTYPPSAPLLQSPFGVLPYSAAQTAMLVVNIVAVAVAGVLLARELSPRIGARGVAVLLLAVGGLDAVASTWANGNVNGVLVLLEVLAIRSMLRGRAMPAAVAVGLSLALKPVLLPFLALFLARRRWRALLVAVAIPLLLNAVGALVISDARRYVTVVLPYLMDGAQLPFNDSVMGVGYRYSLPAVAIVAMRVVIVLCALVLYVRFVSASTRVSARAQLFGEVAIGLSATFLISPISETYYTLFLLPALAWLATISRRAAAEVLVITVVCFGTLRLTGVPDDVHRSVAALALRPTFGWAALLVLVAAALARASATSRLPDVGVRHADQAGGFRAPGEPGHAHVPRLLPPVSPPDGGRAGGSDAAPNRAGSSRTPSVA